MQWIEDIKLKNVQTLEEYNLKCGGELSLFRNHVGVTNFNYTFNYNTVAVEYAQQSVENKEFTPLTFKFKAHTEVDKMEDFKKNIRCEDDKFQLTFSYNEKEFSVYCVIADEKLKDPYKTNMTEEHEITFTTETHFLKIENFPFDMEDVGAGNVGDQLPVQLPFKLDRSSKNSLTEAIVNFEVEGDLRAFLRVEMFGPKTAVTSYDNPTFGLNKRAENTEESFAIKNTPMLNGDILVVDSFPYKREISKNKVNFESQALFLTHDCFVSVSPRDKENRLIFTNCLSGNIKVYNQYRLPR